MSILIKTFGGTRVIRESDVVYARNWPSQKAFSLFRYLVFRRNEGVPVEELYDMFWEEMEEGFAKTNLNTTLYLIRKTTGITSDQLFVKGNMCYFTPGKDVAIDADTFEENHKKLMKVTSGSEREEILTEMFEIYEGPFLVEDSLAEWVQETRDMYESWYSDVLKELFKIYISRDRYDAAYDMIVTYIQREPYDEDMYYKAIEILMKKGDLTKAKHLYDKLSRRLREIGIKPHLSFDQIATGKEAHPLMNGKKAVIVDADFFEKILFLESRRRVKNFVILEIKFKGTNLSTGKIAQKIAPLLRRGDVITSLENSIRILVHCSEQRRSTVENRVKNVLGEMGIEKDQFFIH